VSGRTKYTPWREVAIIDAISKNIPYKLAAEANGIDESTFYAWMKYGKDDRKEGIESEFTRFSELVKKTEMEKIKQHVAYMEEGGKNWQARAWILERRWRELFGADAGIIAEILEEFKKLKEGQESKHG
jgi:hypothetical protein